MYVNVVSLGLYVVFKMTEFAIHNACQLFYNIIKKDFLKNKRIGITTILIRKIVTHNFHKSRDNKKIMNFHFQ